MKTALIIFILTYVLMFSLPKYRSYVAVGSALLFIAFGILPLNRIIPSIDFNVLMMLAGTMGTVYFFIESKMPNRLADILVNKSKNVMTLIIIMSLFAGVVSAFVDNVATLLMIAPVGLAIAKKLDISPVPMLISISVSSNLQGAATLVGDTTSILLAGAAKMSFFDFFFMNGRPGMFFVTELGAVATIPIMMILFRDQKDSVDSCELTPVSDMFPTYLLAANIIVLILASFIPQKPDMANGSICMLFFIIGLIRTLIVKTKREQFKGAFKEIDYMTLLMLAGLFVVIGGIREAGLIDRISELFVEIGGDNLFIMYSIIVWGSVIISAFVDNIPYVATMLPVVSGIAAILGCPPYALYFGLLVGATLGGNLTPFGASANITAIGILRKEGYEVRNSDFLKIGVPFTLTAVLVGYLFVWFVWAI